jgi:hypothetical protein
MPKPFPFPPRAMPEDMAAYYVGLSPTTFRTKVVPAVPAVHLTDRRLAWLREDLDAWLDGQAGRATASTGNNPWDSVL